MLKKDYISDEDLINLIQQGNVVASHELFLRYQNYAWKFAYDFHLANINSGIDLKDFHEVAFASLPQALKGFLLTSGNTFYRYWQTIATNNMLAYLKDNSYQYKAKTFSGLSIDTETDEGLLADVIGQDDNDFSKRLLQEEVDHIIKHIISGFRQENAEMIINLFLHGYTMDKIQQKTGAKIDHIYYVIERFRLRFSQIMKKRNYN